MGEVSRAVILPGLNFSVGSIETHDNSFFRHIERGGALPGMGNIEEVE